tara:strand:+ start:246 stop:518 length:273 start_codon:yes stop_codon:yes gene_type:complete
MSLSGSIDVQATLGEIRFGAPSVTVTVGQIEDAVEGISSIPVDANKAVKDFLSQVFENISDGVQNIEIPIELIDYSKEILDIIQSLVNYT